MLFLFSCSSSDVVGNGRIQKRKYNSGFYVSFNKKFKQNFEKDKSLDEANVIEQLENIEQEEPNTQNLA